MNHCLCPNCMTYIYSIYVRLVRLFVGYTFEHSLRFLALIISIEMSSSLCDLQPRDICIEFNSSPNEHLRNVKEYWLLTIRWTAPPELLNSATTVRAVPEFFYHFIWYHFDGDDELQPREAFEFDVSRLSMELHVPAAGRYMVMMRLEALLTSLPSLPPYQSAFGWSTKCTQKQCVYSGA